MKVLVVGLAALPFLAGVASAGQPTVLYDAQMDKITAGSIIEEIQSQSTSFNPLGFQTQSTLFDPQRFQSQSTSFNPQGFQSQSTSFNPQGF